MIGYYLSSNNEMCYSTKTQTFSRTQTAYVYHFDSTSFFFVRSFNLFARNILFFVLLFCMFVPFCSDRGTGKDHLTTGKSPIIGDFTDTATERYAVTGPVNGVFRFKIQKYKSHLKKTVTITVKTVRGNWQPPGGTETLTLATRAEIWLLNRDHDDPSEDRACWPLLSHVISTPLYPGTVSTVSSIVY